MALTEFIEEFDGGFLQPLIVKNSDEADSSLPSLQEKVDSRIRDKFEAPPKVDCELSPSRQGRPKHLVASSKKKFELYKTPSQWQKILRSERYLV